MLYDFEVFEQQNLFNLPTDKKFPERLFDLVNDPTLSDVIEWREGGGILIKNRLMFEIDKERFGSCCKTTFENFRRKLNKYGFKAMDLDDDADGQMMWIIHEKFIQGRPDLVLQIARKNVSDLVVTKVDLAKIRDEATSIQADVIGAQTQIHGAQRSLIRAQVQVKVDVLNSIIDSLSVDG